MQVRYPCSVSTAVEHLHEGVVPCEHPRQLNLTAANIHDQYSVSPSVRSICTRCCFTVTNMIRACSNFHRACVFIINTHPDEISPEACVAAGFVHALLGGRECDGEFWGRGGRGGRETPPEGRTQCRGLGHDWVDAGGCKTHRLLYHSTLGSRVINKNRRRRRNARARGRAGFATVGRKQ